MNKETLKKGSVIGSLLSSAGLLLIKFSTTIFSFPIDITNILNLLIAVFIPLLLISIIALGVLFYRNNFMNPTLSSTSYPSRTANSTDSINQDHQNPAKLDEKAANQSPDIQFLENLKEEMDCCFLTIPLSWLPLVFACTFSIIGIILYLSIPYIGSDGTDYSIFLLIGGSILFSLSAFIVLIHLRTWKYILQFRRAMYIQERFRVATKLISVYRSATEENIYVLDAAKAILTDLAKLEDL